MSFGGKTDLALDLTNPEQDRNSTYQEATPLPDVRGNGNLGLIWICKNTEPKLTKVGSTHFHYHGSIAGLLNHGIVKWIGTISINGKVVDNLDYTWNGSETYHDFTIDTDGGHTTVQTSVRVYFGTETQTADSILNAFHAQTHPAYRGQAYIVFQNLYGGDGTFRVPNVTVQFRSTCEFDYDATTYGDTAFGTGINPVTHLHHMVTHPRAGLGIDEDAAFDMADMAAKYLRYDSEANTSYGAATTGYINPQLTKNRKAKDWIKENLSYFDGFITLRNGKLNLDWFPHEAISPASPSEYTTIYQADLVDKPDIEFPVWEDTISSVAIDFINIEKSSRKSSLVVSSTHNSTVLGENRTEQITRDWFWWEYQVQSYGERYLAAKESPLFSGKLNIKRDRAVNPDNGNVEADRRGVSFLPGHVFLWNYAPYSIAVYCRITSINPRGHTYEVSFVQERGTYPVEYIPTPDQVPDLTLPTPDPLDNWALYNLPPALTGHYKNYLGVLAERFTKKTVSWDITFNDSDTWGTEVAYLLEQVSFAARFEIQESVADEAGPTTFEILGSTSNVDMTDIMQSLDAKQAEDNTLLLFVGTEVMSLEANSLLGAANYDVTAYRGRYSTPTAAYSTSQVCWVIPRANLIQWYHEKFDLVYTAGAYDSGLATKWFKTNTYNFYQEGTWSSSQSFVLADQLPEAPTGFAATAVTEGVYFTWTDSVSPDILWYEVLVGHDSGFATSFIARSSGAALFVSGLSAGTARWGKVRAVNKTGNRSSYTSDDSATATAPPVGDDAITHYLTNSAHVVDADWDGTGYSLTGAGGTHKVFDGTSDVTTSATHSVIGSPSGGLTMSVVAGTGVYSLSGTGTWTTENETFTLRANYGAINHDAVYTITKALRSRRSKSGRVYYNTAVGAAGQHDGADNQAVLTDSAKAWTPSAWIGYVVVNSTTGATGTITANTATTVTATLSSDDWDTGDTYYIRPATPTATNYNFDTESFTSLTAGWQTTPIEVLVSNSQLKYWSSDYSALEDGGAPTFGVPTGSINFAADIQSDNFVAGTSGWRLERDTGDLEVNDGTFRGDVKMESSVDNYKYHILGSDELITFGLYDWDDANLDIIVRENGPTEREIDFRSSVRSPDTNVSGGFQLESIMSDTTGETRLLLDTIDSASVSTYRAFHVRLDTVDDANCFVKSYNLNYEIYTGGPGFGVLNAKFGFDSNGGRLNLYDDLGDKRVDIYCNASSQGAISLYGSNDLQGVLHYVTTDGGRSSWYDDGGAIRALIYVPSSGNGSMYLYCAGTSGASANLGSVNYADANGGRYIIYSNLVASSARVSMGVDVHDDGYAFFYDDALNVQVALRADTGIDTTGVPIAVRKSGINGVSIAYMTTGSYGGDIRVRNDAGNSKIAMVVRSDDGGQLTCYNNDDSVGFYAYALDTYGGTIDLNNSAGSYRARFGFKDTAGSPYLLMKDGGGTNNDVEIYSDVSSGGMVWVGNAGTHNSVLWNGGVRTTATVEIRDSLPSGNLRLDLASASSYGRIRLFDNAGTPVEQISFNANGVVMMKNLPTSDPVNTGQLWNNSGVLTIS